MNGSDAASRPIRSWPRAYAETLPSSGFVRFLGVGALNTVFGYLVFILALGLRANVGVALVASTMMGIIFNFQTSRRIVFQSRQAGRLPRFVAVYVTVLVVDYAGVLALKDLGLPNWAAQAVLALPMALLGFLAQRNLVFGETKRFA